ncbi:MAG: hypothetical protein GDA51_00190 [Ekhidna sp.]|nr:hypothetical protein [Ekhidna sp.]
MRPISDRTRLHPVDDFGFNMYAHRSEVGEVPMGVGDSVSRGEVRHLFRHSNVPSYGNKKGGSPGAALRQSCPSLI